MLTRVINIISFLLVVILFIGVYYFVPPVSEELLDSAVKNSVANIRNISLLVAFLGGLLSFFSPCMLPIGLAVTGISLKTQSKKERLKNILFFAGGFFIIFLLLGFSVTFFGQLLIINKSYIVLFSGVAILLLGIILLLDRFKLPVTWSNFLKNHPTLNVWFGLFFAAGFNPCVGPVLFSILFMASNSDNYIYSALLILLYVLGVFTPFLILLFFFPNYNIRVFKNIRLFSGLILIFLGGVYIVYGSSTVLNYNLFGLGKVIYIWQSKLLEAW